jgi:hypothetical protein
MQKSIAQGIFVLIGLVVFVSPAQAELQWELQSGENQLTLKGSCDTDVRIELYESDNFELEPTYTATAACFDGAFAHDDNLLKWEIADGEYRLVVDSDRHTVQSFVIKEPPVTTEEALAREVREKGLSAELGFSANQVFENAQASFGEKLYALQTDFLTMQTALKDTTYPDFIKVGLGASLGLMGSTLEQLADTFFTVEQRDFVDPSTSIESLETVAAPEPASAPEEILTETVTEDPGTETGTSPEPPIESSSTTDSL